MISRRAFVRAVAGGVLTAPLAVQVQPGGRVYRIGVLGYRSLESQSTHLWEAFGQGGDFKPAKRDPARERTHWNGWGSRR